MRLCALWAAGTYEVVYHCGACAGLVAVTRVHLCTVLTSNSWGHEVVPVSGWGVTMYQDLCGYVLLVPLELI